MVGGKQKNPTLTKKEEKENKNKNAHLIFRFPNFSFELILQSKGPMHRYPHPTVTRKK
jgi:hypothetical protein